MKSPLAVRLWFAVSLLFGIPLLAGGCGGGGGGKASASTADTTTRTPAGFDFGPNVPLTVSAFGDSITQGVLGDADGRVVTTGNNYPNNLQIALRTLDPGFRVVNRGLGGEVTSEGRRRLPGILARDKSGFVLIMEGTNDADEGEDPTFILANLEAMVTTAQGNHTIPVIGTIPPNFRNPSFPQEIIRVTNNMIRTMATTRRVVVAEIFDGMNDRTLFGSPERGIRDPLHPNERGYVTMAGIWFTAMRLAIPEAAPPPPPPAPPPAPAPAPTDVGQRVRRK